MGALSDISWSWQNLTLKNMVTKNTFLLLLLILATSTGEDWHKCPTSHFTLPELKEVHNPNNLSDPGSCVTDVQGSTNWFGVMSAVTGLIPGLEFISALGGIVSSISFSGGYSDDLNECTKHMIFQALIGHDLEKCRLRMDNIEGYKKEFLKLLDKPLSDSTTLTFAMNYIQDIKDDFSEIKIDFRADDPGVDNHHEKFLDFLFDSLATMESTKLLLVDAMERQNLPNSEICLVVEPYFSDMKSRHQELFDYSSSSSLQKTLDQSAFNTWQTQLWHHHEDEYKPPYTFYRTLVHDDYRGSENSYDSYTCNFCEVTITPTDARDYCKIEVGMGDVTVEPYDDWEQNPEVLCNHCLDYIANQQATRRQQISDAGDNLQKMIDSMKEIGDRLGCVLGVTV